MNEEFDNDTQLTAALFGELSADSAKAVATDRPEELAELQGVLDALKADLPSDVAPLSDARRDAILAVAAELDVSLAVLPLVEAPPVIETHWFRRQMPMILAALFVLGAGVASLMMMNKTPNTEVAKVESSLEREGLEALPELSEMADVIAIAADNGDEPEAGDLILDDAEMADVTVSAAELVDAIAVTAAVQEAPETAAEEDAAAEEFQVVTEEAPIVVAPEEKLDLAASDNVSVAERPRPRLKAKMRARDQPKSLALTEVPAAEAPAAFGAAQPAAAALSAPPAPSAPAVQPAARAAKAARREASAGQAEAARAMLDQVSTPQARGAQMVAVEHAPSPVHADRLLLVVHAPNSRVTFDATLVRGHRQLAPGVYEVTLNAGARRGAFAAVIVGDVSVPVAIEAGKAAFDQASVAYRMAVLKALDIQAIDHALPAKD